MFVVLLTNRVHAARARAAKVIADVRADLADAAALAVTDSIRGMLAMPGRSAPTEPWGGTRPSPPARPRPRRGAREVRSSKSRRGARRRLDEEGRDFEEADEPQDSAAASRR